MSMSNYLENAIGNHVLRNTALTSPTTVYLAVHTADPTETGATDEVSGNNYARKAITFGAPSNGVFTSNADVVFDQASGSWGTITHCTIWDAVSGGNCLYVGTLTASRSVPTGSILTFASGDVTVTHD